MKILAPTELISSYFESARKEALKSTCKRAKCGSIVVRDNAIIGLGFNSPPRNKSNSRCLRKHEIKPGFKSDKTCCIHAEQRAIIDSLSYSYNKNVSLYYVRLDNHGNIKPSGKPYCTICSKMALDVGIKYFTLIHPEGITQYGTKEYNDLSFEYNG
jgi:deoxycytidylate deaminase